MKSEYQRFKMDNWDYSRTEGEGERSQLFITRMETIVSEEGRKFLDPQK